MNYDIWRSAICIINSANIMDDRDLLYNINALENMICGRINQNASYEDVAGNELLRHVREYLRGKLKDAS